MNNFDTNISELDRANDTRKVQEQSTELPIFVYEPSGSTVASLLGEGKTLPPPSIEARGGDMAVTVTQVVRANDLPDMVKDVQEKLDQIRQFPGDRLMAVGREEIRDILDQLRGLGQPGGTDSGQLRDSDGDGIPDIYDKHPDQTTADVAAEVNKIGKYAITEDNKAKIFSALKGITKSLESLLDKISAMSAAASSSFKPTTDVSASDSLEGEGNPFSSKKVDKEHK
ncbi:MAG: hypothetical protein LBS22_00380 [Puniceicoccales bacterium]|jgi:hypothetical protein|nr:hypothetical protein [Puniceicoccales bacterium]